MSGDRTLHRRSFLKGAAVGGAALWIPAHRIAAARSTTCAPPPGFPSHVPLFLQAFQNWSGAIQIDELWTCAPTTEEELVDVVNWAFQAGYRVRPRGYMHNWSPLTVAADADCEDRVVLVDTTAHLTSIAVSPQTSPATVTAQTGASMEELLTQLEAFGLGLTAFPAPGDITVGGALAIDGHGAAVPSAGEGTLPGTTWGSLSNQIVSLRAIVWDAAIGAYRAREFPRSDPDSCALLTHVGRAFLTEVTLQAGVNSYLRCESHLGVHVDELFAHPDQWWFVRKLAKYLNDAGRAEAIWFPFHPFPWLKVWSVAPTKPLVSKAVDQPYNYTFSDTLTDEQADLIEEIVAGNAALTPTLGAVSQAAVVFGLGATQTWDLWGPSKNLMLYVRPTTLRVTANGYAILMRRSDVQLGLWQFVEKFKELRDQYAAAGSYPMNGPVEIRVTGLDQVDDVGVAAAGPPSLSAVRPRPDKPEWDVAVWLDILTFPGTPDSNRFYREMEEWIYATYSGDYAMVRPEWSKGYAYTDEAAWSSPVSFRRRIPEAFRAGQPAWSNWDATMAKLNELDRFRVFTSPFLDKLMP